MLRIIMFFYQWVILCPIFLVTTIITAIATIVGSLLFNNRYWGFYPARLWSIITCYTAFCPVKVYGRENIDKNQSYIFVANHQGAFDIFLIYGFLNHNFRWIMKQELKKIPFVGAACATAGHIFVDRSSTSSIKASLGKARRELNGGLSVVVFPEGSRSKTGKMGQLKKGAFQLATDLNLPIVPVTIEGSYQIMPRGTYTLHPTPLKLVIHKPIPTSGLTTDDIPALIERSRTAISSGFTTATNPV